MITNAFTIKKLRFVCLTFTGLMLILASFAVPLNSVQAANFDVGAGDTAGLINAINNANANPPSTVTLAANSTYNIANPFNNIFGNNGLPPITGNVTINGNGSVINRTFGGEMRFFYLAPNATLSLNNVTLRNANSNENGGGVLNLGGTLNTNGAKFENNNAVKGGAAIFNTSGNLFLTQSTFQGNTAPTSGAAILIQTGTANISGSTFTNNQTALTDGIGGGGIFNIGGTVNLTTSTFTGNKAPSGGGIFNAPGRTLTVLSSTFSGNTAQGAGTDSAGGAITNSGSATITNSTFTNNVGAPGGFAAAIYTYKTPGQSNYSMTIESSTFTGNSVTKSGAGLGGLGGALTALGPGTLTVNNSTFNNNSSDNGGGVLYNGSSTVIFSNSTFKNNSSATGSGGAIANITGPEYPNDNVNLTVNNSTFYNNSTGGGGGAIIHSPTAGKGTTTVTNTTFLDNSAVSGGGTVFNQSGTFSIRNSLLINGKNNGADQNCSNPSAFSGGSNNLAFPEATNCGSGVTIVGANPLNGTPANNGGLTETIALSGAPNPAIDGANTTLCPATDQRGFGRNGTCDIGSFESGGFAPQTGGTLVLLPGTVRVAFATASTGTRLTSQGTTPTIGNSSTLEISIGGSNNIPQNATGVFGVLTNIGCNGGANFRFWAGGTAPNAANLNIPAASPALNLSTGFVASISGSGKLYLGLASGGSVTCGYAVDISGYLTTPGGGDSINLLTASQRVATTQDNSSPKLTSQGTAPAIGNSSTVEITVGGTSGIPAGAKGVLGVLTNVGCTGGGNLRLWAGGTAPDATNLNIPGAFPSLNLSTNFIAPLSSTGKIYLGIASGVSIECGYVVDIVGYISTGNNGLGSNLLPASVRVATTQNNAAPTLLAQGGTPAIGNGSAAPIIAGGTSGIPTTAKGIFGVVTNLGCNAGGNFRFWTGGTAPFASNLNIPGVFPALNLSTGFVAPLDSLGRVFLGFGSGANNRCGYVLDVNAYLQ